MLTLTESNKHSTNKVRKGVIEEIIKDEYTFKKIPYAETDGIAYQYVRENSLGPSVSFIDPNEVIPEGTGTTTQVTATLKILAAHADVDHHLAKTRSNYYDFVAEIIQMRTKGIKHRIMNRFYYGDEATNTKEPNGLHALKTSAMTLARGSGSSAQNLTTSYMDQLLDLFINGDPDCLHMPRSVRRLLNEYMRLNGLLVTDRDEWGKLVMFYNNIPIVVDNNMSEAEALSGGAYSAETGGTACTSVFALKYSQDGVFGIQNSGGLKVWKLTENLEAKDSTRYRFLWYMAWALAGTLQLGAITGVSTTSAVTAS